MSNTDFDPTLLDLDLDDIEELPGFEVPWPGRYLMRLTAAMKEINNKSGLELSYEVVECLEKNDPSSPDTAAGTKFSQVFFLTGTPEAVKTAKSFLKQQLKGIAEAVGEGNLLVLIRDHLQGVMVEATVNRRKDKDDPERFYPVIKNMTLA